MHPPASRPDDVSDRARVRPSGFVFRLEKARGASWWAKYRLPDGTQVKRKIGPVWAGRGRPAEGHFTKRLAEDWLHDSSTRSGGSGRSATLRAAVHRRPGLGRHPPIRLAQARRSPTRPRSTSASRSRTAAASPRRSATTATRSTSICCRCSARWRSRTSRSRRSSAGAPACRAPASSASSPTRPRTTCSC